MRPTMLATVPLLAALISSPAAAQITARVHIDIPIGRGPDVRYPPEAASREIRIYDYDRDDYGDWDRDRDYRRWQPVTVYFFAGRYYERPIRGGRTMIIYRYGNRYFFPPRDTRWEQRYGRDNDWGRRDDRDDRSARDRDNRNGRDRDDRNARDRDDRNGQGRDNRNNDARGQDQRGQGGGRQDSRGQDQRGQTSGRQDSHGRPDQRVPDVRGGRSRP
jgi:hypothetical protein